MNKLDRGDGTDMDPADRARSKQPLVSLIMPVHEGAEWIGATLQSLAAIETPDLEIIAIDSSPSTATQKIIDSFQARLPLRQFRRPDLGSWQSKTNWGVELATADHVCILHQDDLWLPGRLNAIRRWIASAPDASLHFAPTLVIDRNGSTLGRWACPLPSERPLAADFVLERLLVQNFVAVPATLFRRSAWLKCGGMDEALWYTPDWDVWVKLAAAGAVIYHDEVTTAFRVHGSSLTVTGARDTSDFRSQMQIVIDRHLDRLPARARRRVKPAAEASICVNVSLAAASAGSVMALWRPLAAILSLGPVGVRRYLRDSRLRDRVVPRIRAKLAGSL